MNDLKRIIDHYNPYAKIYRMVANYISQDGIIDLKLRKRSKAGRSYNMLTVLEVAAFIVGDFETMPQKI